MLSKLKYSINVFLGSLIGMVVICSTITVIWDFSFLYSLFVRRVFYVPALLNFTYYDYFQGLEFVKLSNGALGWLFDYQLEDIPPRMVNFYLRGTVTGWANTGFLGSSYMHFGFIGMLLYSLIVGLLFRLTDSLTVDRLPIWVGLSILIDPYVNLFTGADLTSALATHGLGIGTVMLWLMSGERLNAANIRDVQVRR
jgi:hypothetical protein